MSKKLAIENLQWNFRRCERIRWPKPIIEHDGDDDMKVWRNQRRGEQRICLWFEQESYLVILADRGSYIPISWNSRTGNASCKRNMKKILPEKRIERLKPPRRTALLLLLHMVDELYIISAKNGESQELFLTEAGM